MSATCHTASQPPGTQQAGHGPAARERGVSAADGGRGGGRGLCGGGARTPPGAETVSVSRRRFSDSLVKNCGWDGILQPPPSGLVGRTGLSREGDPGQFGPSSARPPAGGRGVQTPGALPPLCRRDSTSAAQTHRGQASCSVSEQRRSPGRRPPTPWSPRLPNPRESATGWLERQGERREGTGRRDWGVYTLTAFAHSFIHLAVGQGCAGRPYTGRCRQTTEAESWTRPTWASTPDLSRLESGKKYPVQAHASLLEATGGFKEEVSQTYRTEKTQMKAAGAGQGGLPEPTWGTR